MVAPPIKRTLKCQQLLIFQLLPVLYKTIRAPTLLRCRDKDHLELSFVNVALHRYSTLTTVVKFHFYYWWNMFIRYSISTDNVFCSYRSAESSEFVSNFRNTIDTIAIEIENKSLIVCVIFILKIINLQLFYFFLDLNEKIIDDF